MVTVASPSVAMLLAVNESRLLPVVGFGLNEAVTPLGKPDAARLTPPVNPPAAVTVTVLAPDAPWVIVRPPGFAARVKLGGMETV